MQNLRMLEIIVLLKSLVKLKSYLLDRKAQNTIGLPVGTSAP